MLEYQDKGYSCLGLHHRCTVLLKLCLCSFYPHKFKGSCSKSVPQQLYPSYDCNSITVRCITKNACFRPYNLTSKIVLWAGGCFLILVKSNMCVKYKKYITWISDHKGLWYTKSLFLDIRPIIYNGNKL